MNHIPKVATSVINILPHIQYFYLKVSFYQNKYISLIIIIYFVYFHHFFAFIHFLLTVLYCLIK